MAENLKVDSLEERLISHARAFDGLLSLIPAKFYHGEDTSDQWQRQKQTKEEARAAKMAKLDPANYKSAKDVLDEQQAAQRKRKREEEEDISSGSKEQTEIASTNQDRKQSKKRKREEKGDNTVFRQRQKSEKDGSTVAEDKRNDKAEKRRQKRERKKRNAENKAAKVEAKKQKQKEKAVDNRKDDIGQSEGGGGDIEDDVGIEGLDVEQEDLDNQHQPSTTVSPSPAHSPAFDDTSGSSSITSMTASTKSTDNQLADKNSDQHQDRPEYPKASNSPTEQPPNSVLEGAETGKSSPEELKARLQSRIDALRTARKADGPDGQPARSRQELLETRRRAEEGRKAQKKELRRKAKEEEARKRAETLARGSPLLSPGSPMSPSLTQQPSNLSFGRIDFGDGHQASSDLKAIKEPRSRTKGPPDPATALIAAQNKQSRLAGLDPEKQADIAEKDVWLNAKKRAHGERVRDDTNLLKKTLKRKQKQKKKSESEWRERLEGIKKGQEMRQKKREANLSKRKEEKGGKGKKSKKSKNRPGFEGSFRAKAPSGDKKRK